MKRRGLLYAGAAAAAAVAGAGVALWRWRLSAPEAGAGGLPAFWGATLDGMDGAPVAMSSFRGRPLLVNFWATWCPPCVEELPLLDRFHLQQRERGWQMLGLAVDQPSAVRRWLERSPLSFPVVLAGLQGTEMSRELGNQANGLPFSVLFDAKGQVLERKLGQLHEPDLAAWARRA